MRGTGKRHRYEKKMASGDVDKGDPLFYIS
jgi:hypothetical protein